MQLWLLLLGVVARVCAYLFGHDVLRSRMELVSPLTGFLHVEEALFLQDLGKNPYADGDFHQPPLLLALFHGCKVVAGVEYFQLLAATVVIVADLLAAGCIVRILRDFTFSTSARKQDRDAVESVPETDLVFVDTPKKSFLSSFAVDPSKAAKSLEAFVLLNPLTVLTVGALSGSVFLHAALAGALVLAMQTQRAGSSRGRTLVATHASCVCLAFAAHCSLTMAVAALPVCVLLAQRGDSNGSSTKRVHARVLLGCLLLVAAYWVTFLRISAFTLGGSWAFLTEYYAWAFAMRGSLAPNIGFWWYVFQEVFERFRGFYLVFWAMQPLLFFVPVSVALRKRPAAAAVVLVFLVLFTQPHPTVGDTAFGLACMSAFPATCARIQYVNFLKCLLIFPIVLLPVMWYLWLHPTSGNANFIYFQTIVFQIASIRLVASFTGSAVAIQKVFDAGSRLKKQS